MTAPTQPEPARVTLDFESFYDREVSLSKMTPLQYIMDPRCQIIGASLRVDNHPIGLGSGAERRPFSRKAMWFNGRQLPEVFAKIPWSQVTLVSHNIGFDGAVLAWRYGHVPALYVDTLGLSRAHLFPYTGSASLGKVSDYLGLPPKDSDALANALGWTLEMLEHDESVGGTRYPRYRKYCCIDTDNCESITNRLVPFTPPEEIILADMVARMAIQPQFTINREVLVTHLAKVKADKARLVETLINKGIIEQPEPGAENKPPQLMSDVKLAEILTNLGVDPPMKISAATGKVGYAFAKTDKAFTALLEHEDPDVQIVAAARLGVKTTLEESRTERFIGCADVRWQYAAMPAMLPQGLASTFPMPFPLKFSGAHTHRLSGDWKLNLQNLGRDSPLRRALEAPPGYSVVSADASQIEARIVCWLAGAVRPLNDFRTKSDPYSNLASLIFGYKVTKESAKTIHKMERFVGKTAILGLGFGMGERRFQVTCWNQGKQVVDEATSKRTVKTYREDYAPEVKTYWGRMEYMLDNMIIGNDIQLGPIRSAGKRILLPSGLMLHYPNLRKEPRPAPWDPTQAVQQFVFDYGNEVVTLFGGKATENVVQALARIATMNVAYRIRMNYGSQFPLAGQVHDQLAYVVPTQYAQWFLDNVLIPEMRAPLPWCVDLPLDAEGGVGANFADAK